MPVVRAGPDANGYRAYYGRASRAAAGLCATDPTPVSDRGPGRAAHRGRARPGRAGGHLGVGARRAARSRRAYDRDRLEPPGCRTDRRAGACSGFAREVVMPLAIEVGDLWALARSRSGGAPGPARWCCTPLKAGSGVARQRAHLRGGAAAARAARVGLPLLPGRRAELGWQIHYLGATATDEIVEAAWKRQATAVALSASDPRRTWNRCCPRWRQIPGASARTFAVIGGGG